MKINFTKSFASALFVTALLLASFTKSSASISAPASCTAVIGNPANGLEHHIQVSWSAVGGATSYKLESSLDNSTWYTILYAYGITTYDDDPSNTGNVSVYYRVSSTGSGDTSAATNCTQFPIYTACDIPALPSLSNAGSGTLSLQITPESPTPNSSSTTYSVYCTTTGQYLQSNGTLGSTQVFNTMSTWGTVNVTGLGFNTSYCFYAAARNNDGDIRTDAGTGLASAQTFDASSSLVTSGSSTTKWWTVSCSGSSEIRWHSTGGCNGGSGAGCVGYTTSPGTYYGCFLTSPIVNCSGLSQVTMTFDLSSSVSTLGDSIYFSIWSNTSNQYYPASAGATPAVVSSVNGASTDVIKLNTDYSCQPMTVVWDLSSIPSGDRSSLYFYLNPTFLETSGTTFNVLFDNLGLSQAPPTSCLTTLGPLAVNEINNVASISVFPNPVRDNFTIQTTADVKNAHIVVYDVVGKEIYSENVGVLAMGLAKQIPLAVLPGVYFVEVASEGGKWVSKLVKE